MWKFSHSGNAQTHEGLSQQHFLQNVWFLSAMVGQRLVSLNLPAHIRLLSENTSEVL